MMWWILFIVALLAVIAALSWWRGRREWEWELELEYLTRHLRDRDTPPDHAPVTPKELHLSTPIRNRREDRQTAEQQREVYERTVEKLRDTQPDALQDLCPITDSLADLPIFSGKLSNPDETAVSGKLPPLRMLNAIPLSSLPIQPFADTEDDVSRWLETDLADTLPPMLKNPPQTAEEYAPATDNAEPSPAAALSPLAGRPAPVHFGTPPSRTGQSAQQARTETEPAGQTVPQAPIRSNRSAAARSVLMPSETEAAPTVLPAAHSPTAEPAGRPSETVSSVRSSAEHLPAAANRPSETTPVHSEQRNVAPKASGSPIRAATVAEEPSAVLSAPTTAFTDGVAVPGDNLFVRQDFSQRLGPQTLPEQSLPVSEPLPAETVQPDPDDNGHFAPSERGQAVWFSRDIGPAEPPSAHSPAADLPVIGFDDPAVARTRERTLAEVGKLFAEQPRKENVVAATAAGTPLQTIDESDIRSNLLRQRLARSRQLSAQEPVHELRVIPEDEVLANLAKKPLLTRRLRRISTATQESVLPAAARITEAHSTRVVPQKVPPVAKNKRQDSALNNRFSPYPAERPQPVNTVPPDATVVEPPPVPPTPPLSVDIAPPAAFDAVTAQPVRRAEVHISDNFNWSITDQLQTEAFAESEIGQGLDYRRADAFVTRRKTAAAPAAGYPQEAVETAAVSAPRKPSAEDFFRANLPTLDLLQPASPDPSTVQSAAQLQRNSSIIENKLAEFKVKVKVLDAYSGPVVTRYEIEPDVGVRGSAVTNLEKDLARSLGVSSVRVVETIPGKTCMGLELPNPKRQIIRLSEVFASAAFEESPSRLTLALGHDITGHPVVTDLAKAPHILVAGTTGSGKSVGVNGMILSLLYKAAPEEVRLILIDPKMLELSIYQHIPHLLTPVVTDMKLAANALNWCVSEMERRYRLMSHFGVRNLDGFNRKLKEAEARGESLHNPFSLTPDQPEVLEKLPFIVVVVDEFADLMMTAGKKIEELIARIAQKARAAGIHLILATQRPSVDVITGLIKANIPTRIAFQVSSKIDSRTIIDQSGAENLLGQGDMLFLPPGTGYPQRVHGAYASDDEMHRVVEHLRRLGPPDYVDEILADSSEAEHTAAAGGGSDDLYDQAVLFVIRSQKTTISSVQRHLRIGYNRAANLVEQMERNGVISPADHNGRRTVLAK